MSIYIKDIFLNLYFLGITNPVLLKEGKKKKNFFWNNFECEELEIVVVVFIEFY